MRIAMTEPSPRVPIAVVGVSASLTVGLGGLLTGLRELIVR